MSLHMYRTQLRIGIQTKDAIALCLLTAFFGAVGIDNQTTTLRRHLKDYQWQGSSRQN
ncbi:hypothetical protein H6F61_18005 [Cyanobacteria bacterium FACHB-472]|nr:hypothetical protein [Cyanobacteria bacterium FACHB-472]